VKTRLLGLDFILKNPAFKYLPTELEKVEFFTQAMKVPMSDLPAKVYKTPNSKEETLRYFVDKFPLLLSNLSSAPPVVHFTYVDPGSNTSMADFLNHLRSYGPLFSWMKEVRLLYIYQSSWKWRRAHDLFEAFIRSGCRVKVSDADILKYFQIREAWGSKQYEKVGATELRVLGQGRKKYLGARYETLYEQWKGGERHSPNVHSDTVGNAPTSSFTTYKVTEKYSIFGDLD
jgi:hypothetical protein